MVQAAAMLRQLTPLKLHSTVPYCRRVLVNLPRRSSLIPNMERGRKEEGIQPQENVPYDSIYASHNMQIYKDRKQSNDDQGWKW